MPSSQNPWCRIRGSLHLVIAARIAQDFKKKTRDGNIRNASLQTFEIQSSFNFQQIVGDLFEIREIAVTEKLVNNTYL